MLKRISLILILAFQAILLNAAGGNRIIVEKESESSCQAAEILQRFIGEACGCAPAIVSLDARGVKVRKNDILLSENPSSRVKEDGFEIFTQKGAVIIRGKGKACIYGAVEFLKRFLHMDYWGEDEYSLPKCEPLKVGKIDIVSNPTFSYRQSQNYRLWTDPLYRLWYRLEEPDEEFAGGLWVHTFDRILPADRYGEEHPEYYAYFDGKRHPGSASQWCLSNPEVLERCVERLDSIFRAEPSLNMISISQNDGNNTNCRCPECAAADEEEGGPSGSLIRFINKVAERFPDKKISTLAYLYTVQPPKVTKPAPNVSIMLCDIDCNREVPLTDNDSGREFMKALEGWSEMCDNLFVWDYGINFDCYLSPFPNFRTMKRNFEIFRDHNVKMHFSQISSQRGSDFSEMRSYLANELMWNASADLDSLETHFLDSYYHAAAPYIGEYIHLLEDELAKSGARLWIYDSPVSHKDGMLNDENIRRYDDLFDRAEMAVAQDSAALARVRRTRIPLQFSKLEIDRTRVEKDIARVEADLELFRERSIEYDVESINERLNKPVDYCDMYKGRFLKVNNDNLAYGKKVTYDILPSPAYRKLGETALTDGLFGGLNFVEGWVGWEGIDGSFTVDLGEVTTIHYLSVDFLDKKSSWILMPLSVTYSYSADGNNFIHWSTTEIPENRDGAVRFVPISAESSDGLSARYVRVEVVGGKICPPWHYGVGNPSWFFIDEVTIK